MQEREVARLLLGGEIQCWDKGRVEKGAASLQLNNTGLRSASRYAPYAVRDPFIYSMFSRRGELEGLCGRCHLHAPVQVLFLL